MMYQVSSKDDITAEYVSDTVAEFAKSQTRQNYVDNLEYYAGRNPYILSRRVPDDSGPDNRIPVSYARRIINLVAGYMYKPGLVTYAYDGSDERYETAVRTVFDDNSEPIKTEQVGKQTSIHGVGYEYHYVDKSAQPRFIKLPAPEVIPVYDTEIEPDLVAFIRFVPEGKEEYRVTVVDDMATVEYLKARDGKGIKMVDAPVRHYYGRVPLAVYQNNEEQLGDFDPVEPLIDAYDILMSDSMNEFDRFAWAYLLLKGMELTPENAEKVKRLRVFGNLEDTGDVSFLTKQIDTEFIKFMTDLIRSEIHRQSGIPNLEDYDGAGASGKTLTKFIYLMELFTDPKESYFSQGLLDRIDLVTRILRIQGRGGDDGEWRVIMNRNTPDNSKEQMEIFNGYAGGLSLKTRIEQYADVVDDADSEIEQLESENSSMVFDVMGDGSST